MGTVSLLRIGTNPAVTTCRELLTTNWCQGEESRFHPRVTQVMEAQATDEPSVERSPEPLASSARGDSAAGYTLARRSSCALMATMTVLADIRTAANAGGSRIPCDASTPAASGIATMLYPAAHQRFCIILR